MIKLIKRLEKRIEYWEVWEHNKKLIVHQGFVGETGTSYEKNIPFLQNPNKIMEKLAQKILNQGFEELDEDNLTQFVIHYNGNGGDMEKVLEKRHYIEDLMNECLGWTGNGNCDGGDIGAKEGEINIFCYVIDVNCAKMSIIKELEGKNILDGAIMAYLDSKEDYITVYPEGAAFSL